MSRRARPSWHELGKGQTDRERARRPTDEEIEAPRRDNPDTAPLGLDWSKAELVLPPRKKAASLQLAGDVLDLFKAPGSGCRTDPNRCSAPVSGSISAY